MTRIILTVGCVGKTYADQHYLNVYDFDKHTLDYKYNKTGFENLSNEAFKSIPNRKIRDNWFERYMTDWCRVIDEGKYDIVTGWLQFDCLDYLLEKGYDIEVVLVDSRNNESVYQKRSIQRGNNPLYWLNLKKYFDDTLSKCLTDERIKRWILTEPIYLSDFLVFTGSHLIVDYNQPRSTINYLTKVNGMLGEQFNNCIDTLRALFINLIMSDTEQGFYFMPKSFGKITNRQVHDAWVLSMNLFPMPEHSSSVPYNVLSKDIKDLDTPYTQSLNEIAKHLGLMLKGICVPTGIIGEEFMYDSWYFKDGYRPTYCNFYDDEDDIWSKDD